jgi:sugar transferase (PEP-CTERM/EpsH1 system associated)
MSPASPVATSSSAERESALQSPLAGAAEQRPIRVLHVVPQLGVGGTELALVKVVRGLNDGRFEHHVWAMRSCSDPERWTREFERSPIVVDEGKKGFSFPLRRMARMMRSLQPDIVHSRNWGALEAVLSARMAGVPGIVHSEHGYDPAMLGGLPLRRRVFRRGMYGLANGLFAVTRELGRYHAAQGYIAAARFATIPNGVDTNRFGRNEAASARVREEFGIACDAVVVGWIGRMAPIKDLPTLLRACASLAERFPKMTLLIAGDGPERQKWQAVANDLPFLAGRVVFAAERHDVPDVLSAMDIFVLPSTSEGMSNTLLEAMASELPIVATNAGGTPEVIEDGVSGWLFQPGDDRALVGLLESLLVNPQLRANAGAAARHRVEQEFSLRRMIERYEQLYLQLAERSQNRRNRKDEIKAHVRN